MESRIDIQDLSPVKLSLGRSEVDFAVNRRLKKDEHFVIGVNPDGVVDREVTILRVAKPDESIKAVLFSYACHNTASRESDDRNKRR